MITPHNDLIDRVAELGFSKDMYFRVISNLQVPKTVWLVNDKTDQHCFADIRSPMRNLKKYKLWPS